MSDSTSEPKRASAAAAAPAGARPADGGADVLAAYRAAQRALQSEQALPPDAAAPGAAPHEPDAPRAETRAAILAAAARAVQARPQPVDVDGAVRPDPRRRFRERLPLALAASLLVGTLAWQLAAQFDDGALPPASEGAPAASAPTAAPAAPAASAAAGADAGTPATSTAMTADPNETGRAPRAAPGTAPPAPPASSAAERAPAPRGAASVASVPAPAAAPVASAETAAPLAAPSITAGGTPAPAVPDASRAGSSGPAAGAGPRREAAASPPPPEAVTRLPSEAARQAEARSAAAAEARSDLAAPSPAPAEQQVRTQPVERRLFAEDPASRPLAVWLERIAELRRAGRDAEAEAELQALRRAYPQAEIPPGLTRPLPR